MPPDDPTPAAIEVEPDTSGERDRGHLVLLAITVLLVVVGVVLLILGYVGSSMVTLYASIGCAALAGVILIVVSRLNRRRAVALAGEAGPGPAGSVGEAGVAAGVDQPRGAGDMDAPPAGEAGGAAGSAGPTGVAGDAATVGMAEPADANPSNPSEPAAARPEPGPSADQPGQDPPPG